ncbi:MAG: hypothetical protein WB630_15895 [Candidatus Acidiferrales bacterium]
MSKIWDSLKNVEHYQKKLNKQEDKLSRSVAIPERRCSMRLWAHVPILVYGHAAGDNPFHESTEALHVNNGGGLITLITALYLGQVLLLINKINLKEQQGVVLRELSSYVNRAAIIVAFSQPLTDFWDC